MFYFINFLTPGKRVCMHGSKFACRCANFPVKFVFINPTFCLGSGIRLFRGRFCACAMVVNEATCANISGGHCIYVN